MSSASWQVRWLQQCDVERAEFLKSSELNQVRSWNYSLGVTFPSASGPFPAKKTQGLSVESRNQFHQDSAEWLKLPNLRDNHRLSGYFGEKFVNRVTPDQKLFPARSQESFHVSMDGVHTRSGAFRTVRDLVSQLWFDDADEVTSGAVGICDLTVPTNPCAIINRDLVGCTPSAFEGLERMLRSGVLNAAFHACEALSQLAFRNSRNASRIVNCANPNMIESLDNLLGINIIGSGYESLFDLKCAVLRVLNNCAWNSKQACVRIVEEATLLTHVDEVLEYAKDNFEKRGSILAALDSAIGLLGHLASNEQCRAVLLQRRIAQRYLLPIIFDAEKHVSPTEKYLCAIAGAVEVAIKLTWDSAETQFIPHRAFVQTIVWTLVCSLDGTTWAGITWSSLGRVQALTKLSAVDELKTPLVELQLVEILARLLCQWSPEQGSLVLEYSLLALINLMTLEEARRRMYLAGVHHSLRTVVASTMDDGVTPTARERAVLCVWLLYEWQVSKLESLDRRTVLLVEELEESERCRLELETEHSAVRKTFESALETLGNSHAALTDTCESLVSELHSVRLALKVEQARRSEEEIKTSITLKRTAAAAEVLLHHVRQLMSMSRGYSLEERKGLQMLLETATKLAQNRFEECAGHHDGNILVEDIQANLQPKDSVISNTFKSQCESSLEADDWKGSTWMKKMQQSNATVLQQVQLKVNAVGLKGDMLSPECATASPELRPQEQSAAFGFSPCKAHVLNNGPSIDPIANTLSVQNFKGTESESPVEDQGYGRTEVGIDSECGANSIPDLQIGQRPLDLLGSACKACMSKEIEHNSEFPSLEEEDSEMTANTACVLNLVNPPDERVPNLTFQAPPPVLSVAAANHHFGSGCRLAAPH